ncbi:MAG: phage major capsid protein [Eubacterium sp.]|nr:phage major capsid protein [Eubacterium sp.]
MAYDNLKLEKGLYTTGKSFTKALEELDPSENYKGTELEGLDAFERQLKRFDIKVSGPNSDSISKFYSTSTSSVLFPEYISRVVRAGIDGNSKVEKIIATTTEIDSLDYRSLKFADDMDFSLEQTDEGDAIPECTIKVSSDLTKLKKYGKILTATYEAIKFQRLDLFSITLNKIGESISNDQFKTALESIFTSDFSNVVEVAGDDIEYTDLVNLWAKLQPYNLTTLVVSQKVAAKLLAMPEFRDANAGLDFHGTGRIITPFGAEVIIYGDENDNIFAIDNRYALEKVQAGGVMTEFDKLIDHQFERAAISTIVGFAPIFKDAAAILANE